MGMSCASVAERWPDRKISPPVVLDGPPIVHYKSVYTHNNNFFPPCQQYMHENSFINVVIEERDVVNIFK